VGEAAAMGGWRELGWTCAVILACAEYSWLAVVKKVVPPIPTFLWPLHALLFPAAVLAMLAVPALVIALVYNVVRRRHITALDVAVTVICVSLTLLVLRW